MAATDLEIWLIRHGETEWSLSGAHTSRTDLPLTEKGRQRAVHLQKYLKNQQFSLVLTSPLQRAVETCKLAGLGDAAQTDDDLKEWDYGVYEGRTTADIQKEIPNWSIWSSPILGGESIDQVAARANRVIDRAAAAGGRVALFAHGHILRILGACWIQSPPVIGSRLALGTGAICILGYEHQTRVLTTWNQSTE